jgi:predicted Zn-dependent protease
VGDTREAQKRVDRLNNDFPVSTALQYYWIPTIRAELELNRRTAEAAIELLQKTVPFELGVPPPVGALYPVYVRGQAYLATGNGAAASAEFQKILDHTGLVANFPLGALAHLGLARAYALQKNFAKAKAAYQDFLTLWKDADAYIPVLKEAETEYARLQ